MTKPRVSKPLRPPQHSQWRGSADIIEHHGLSRHVTSGLRLNGDTEKAAWVVADEACVRGHGLVCSVWTGAFHERPPEGDAWQHAAVRNTAVFVATGTPSRVLPSRWYTGKPEKQPIILYTPSTPNGIRPGWFASAPWISRSQGLPAWDTRVTAGKSQSCLICVILGECYRGGCMQTLVEALRWASALIGVLLKDEYSCVHTNAASRQVSGNLLT